MAEGLLTEAQQLSGSATKKKTVVTALEEVNRARRRQELINMLRTVNLNLTHEHIREMRKGRKLPPKDAPAICIHPAEGRHRCPPKFIPDWDDES